MSSDPNWADPARHDTSAATAIPYPRRLRALAFGIGTSEVDTFWRRNVCAKRPRTMLVRTHGYYPKA